MALELHQQLKMQQRMVMTPQLRQAIKLLQLSRLELQETVQQELLENPFLEERVGEADPAEKEILPELSRTDISTDEVYDREVAEEAKWEDYLGEFSSTSRQMQKENDLPDESTPFEARYAVRPTLEAHLMWQLRFSQLTDEEKRVGEEIIGNLSSSGYLEAKIEEIAEITGTTIEFVEHVLHIVQRFDPVGVAARDAKECLLIQLKEMNYDRDPVLVALVTEHLADIEAKKYKMLMRMYHIDNEDFEAYLDIIRELEPMPGASFGDEEPAYISPDVYVYKVNDDFVIALNEEGMPNIQMSDLAQSEIPENISPAEKEYCEQKKRSAAWLLRSLLQRQRTLYKVTESIVRHQRDFFEKGITSLVPLVLKDVADDIEMHESTVSRITTNKYVSTPFGVFELKFFFNSALEQTDGKLVGSESVKALMKTMISEEDPKHPLSDDLLASKLNKQLNVKIARRTVAKYRTQLGIESSSKRKVR